MRSVLGKKERAEQLLQLEKPVQWGWVGLNMKLNEE